MTSGFTVNEEKTLSAIMTRLMSSEDGNYFAYASNILYDLSMVCSMKQNIIWCEKNSCSPELIACYALTLQKAMDRLPVNMRFSV